jgi:hypothetical protein
MLKEKDGERRGWSGRKSSNENSFCSRALRMKHLIRSGMDAMDVSGGGWDALFKRKGARPLLLVLYFGKAKK